MLRKRWADRADLNRCIAQGAATMAVLSENRFILGLGAGERLNEHVIGEGWPGIGEKALRQFFVMR
jgi:alkanesulfonate monooxygenase SsuD/methylene tetrahydromethanopterin reductase-like flavin-dependent oxidoreductase (luciferase family)